jgi:predicted transcriptional regulator
MDFGLGTGFSGWLGETGLMKLLLCNGSRSLLDIAKQVNQNLTNLARVIAKFRRAGIIDIQKGAAPTSAAEANNTAYLPDAPGVTNASTGNTPRYWRGKLVE